jgi:glutamate transport system substrate-binding protein
VRSELSIDRFHIGYAMVVATTAPARRAADGGGGPPLVIDQYRQICWIVAGRAGHPGDLHGSRPRPGRPMPLFRRRGRCEPAGCGHRSWCVAKESTMRASPWHSLLVLAALTVTASCVSPGRPAPRHSRFFNKPDLHIGVFDDQAQIGLYDRAAKRWSGFEIDVATYVMGRLRITSSPRQPILYSVWPADRQKSLQSGGNDLVIASYSITDERIRQGISFSRPYLLSFQDILVRRSEAAVIKNVTDLRGRKVCTGPANSTPYQQLRFINRQRELGIEIVPVVGNQACVEKLLKKEVDAVVSDVAVILGDLADHPDLHRVGAKVWPRPEQYGIGFIARSHFDIDEINAAVTAMLNDGTWRKIVIRNFCPARRAGDEPCSAARLFLDRPPPST